MDIIRLTLWRALIAGVIGFSVGRTSLNSNLSSIYLTDAQDTTRWTIWSLEAEIIEYQKKFHVLPSCQWALQDWQNKQNHTNLAGPYRDGWGRPFIYKVSREGYELISYGEDGVPDGSGLDADLSNLNPEPAQAMLSEKEIYNHPDSGGVVITSTICGVLTFFMVFFRLKLNSRSGWAWAWFGVKLFFTLIATVGMGIIITLFHVPSGH